MTDSTSPAPPLAILLELTHRCPLQCLYCSNPVELQGARAELATEDWIRVLDQAADLGVLQVHFSGGEPTARRDLAVLVGHARARGLYSNLITSGVAITRERLAGLAQAGLDHVQLSFQDTDPASAETIGNCPGAQGRKLDFARWVRDLLLPLTVNAVVHRQNIARIEAMIDLALELGAARVEIAHVQYYGWALLNRDALMPSLEQLREATCKVEAARDRLRGKIVIDYVIPDYYARQPKACMGGWGRQFLNITPAGKVLPCHAAETIRDLPFDSVKDMPLAKIWHNSVAFKRFRGTDWMPEPCQSCDQREVDWGGCRCQALAVTGSAAATDPACALSPWNQTLRQLAAEASGAEAPALRYRKIGQPAGASA